LIWILVVLLLPVIGSILYFNSASDNKLREWQQSKIKRNSQDPLFLTSFSDNNVVSLSTMCVVSIRFTSK
jgi:hypothetical protein